MLNTSIVYIILRTLPESFIAVFSALFLLGIEIDKKILINKSMMLSLFVVAIRHLPINYGIHTMLSMVILGMIIFTLSNRDVIKTILATGSFFIALGFGEAIYVFIVTKIIKMPIEWLLDRESWIGAISTLPSLLITLVIILLIKNIINKKNLVKG